ncbi:hypothetical protein EYC80_006421 [Monilinia laxa]|uniref:Uncharacterized protein n=1 Tax=Monilinia laxa TaxID=61186 RepID=A0A5N6JUK0_MONLA|nr:hypothetical protein EYC80_006421 [Monilinia laxa]
MFLQPTLLAALLLFNFCGAAVLYTNSTPSTLSASRISGVASSTITPSATLSFANVQSTTELFPVTPRPYWGSQSIPINTCTSWNLGGITPQLVWTPCHIFAGTVQLSYFPSASGNFTYPSTYYNEAIGITMTSPSMYMVINTISGYNSCGQVGPTMSNVVISMDPTDVSTIARYTASDQQVNTTPAALLTLNDIISGCSTLTMTEGSTDGAILNLHAMDNEYNRCFPAVAIPTPQIESLGLPYFRHCGQDNARLGLFDPPGAVPFANGLLPVTSASPARPTTMPASTAQSPSPNQPSKTFMENSPLPSTSFSAAQVQASNSAASDSSIPSTEAPSSDLFSTAVLAVQAPTTTIDSPQPVSSAVIVPANTPIPIATIASSIIFAVPGDSTVVVAGQTASLNGAPMTLSSSLIQLTPSGLVVANINGDSSQSSIYTIPTAAAVNSAVVPTQIATLAGGEIISASAGVSTIVIVGQTITSGGSSVTISGTHQHASLESQGLVVEGPDGLVLTFSVPIPVPASAAVPSPIATLAGGGIISAVADATNLHLGPQALSLNGPAITLSNSAIVSFGQGGLIVQHLAGVKSTFTLPTSTPQPNPEASISITEIRTSEIIIYSSGTPISSYYTTLISGKDVQGTPTITPNKPGVLAIQTGDGNSNASAIETAGATAMSKFVLKSGVEKSKTVRSLVIKLSCVGVLGIGCLMMG